MAQISRMRFAAVVAVVSCFGAGLLALAARAVGAVEWSWAAALSPFSGIGAAIGIVATVTLLGTRLQRVDEPESGSSDTGVGDTPQPDHLEGPACAADAGEEILLEHPEILAALCHGFRLRRLQPKLFGASIVDPWGIYQKALRATPQEFARLKELAHKHLEAFATGGKGRRLSDADAMKRSVTRFWKCAERRFSSNPYCTFEHVVVIFGADASPNRDMHLRNVAPKVRTLLERLYPQLATASLADGSHVRYAEWQKQAAGDKQELARLKKEQERHNKRIAETLQQLADANLRTEALRSQIEGARREAIAVARADQARAFEELRTASDQRRMELTREIQRLEQENARLIETMGLVTAERDSLEVLLCQPEGEDADESAAVQLGKLAGLRVLLVGGEPRQIGALRDRVEQHGIRLLHEDSHVAADLVGNVNLVVIWTKYLSHPKMIAVKKACNNRGAPYRIWNETSPVKFLALIAGSAGR